MNFKEDEHLRGYVVKNGAITLQGTAKELLANEQVRAAYLGL